MLGLKEAAELAGVAESTIYRAAKSGRISANSGDAGRLLFDPAEVTRWGASRPGRTSATERLSEPRTDALIADLPDHLRTIERLEVELAAERRRIMDLERERDRLERDRDRWADLASGTLRQLADQRAVPATRPGFWGRLFG